MRKPAILILLSLSILITFLESCTTKCDCLDTYIGVSEYDVKKSIVQTNTTNFATGFETIFESSYLNTLIVNDSAYYAQMCQSVINPIRFFDDESGYFFIETINDAWVVAHINHDLIGTSRINIQDENGKFFIQEIVETVKYAGYGFVEYYRKNPSTLENERKLSFVTSIPSANWFIGTGFYGGPSSAY